MKNQFILFLEKEVNRHDKSIRKYARTIGISHTMVGQVINEKKRAGLTFFRALHKHTTLSIGYFERLQDASIDDPPVEKEYDVDLTDDQQAALNWFRSLSDEERKSILDWDRQRRDGENSEWGSNAE